MNEETVTKNNRETWAGHLEYILSLFGYLSGAGDFWKFPYLFWRNGGGTFVIVYLLAVMMCSIPMYFLEVTISQYSGKGMYDVWCICPLFTGIRLTMFIVNVVILLVYPTVRFWIMAYIRHSFHSTLPWTTCGNSWNTKACFDGTNVHVSDINNDNRTQWFTDVPTGSPMSNMKSNLSTSSEEEFWKYKLLKESSGIQEIGSLNWDLVLCSFLLRAIVAICVIKSIKSIGKVVYVTTFIPFILLIVVWIRTLLLPGSTDGLLFFLKPDLSKLTDGQMWMQAGFLALNSLSVGLGGTLVIGSRGNVRSSVLRSTICACSLDVFGSIFTSIVLFSVLGVMAAEQNIPMTSVIESGTSIAFVGFTRAFSFLPSPKIWSIIYFTAAFVAILDVIVMTTEVVITFIMQWIKFFRNNHLLVVFGVSSLSFILSLPFVSQAGPYIFQLCQWYYGTWSTLIAALVESTICMWIFGGDRIDKILKSMVGRPMPAILRILAAFVCPVIYVVFLIISIITFRPPTYGKYHFPLAAELFGYCLGILPILPVPIVMAIKIRKMDGPFLKKLWSQLQPSAEWGPVEEEKDVTMCSITGGDNSLIDTAYYNITGRCRTQRTNVQLSDIGS